MARAVLDCGTLSHLPKLFQQAAKNYTCQPGRPANANHRQNDQGPGQSDQGRVYSLEMRAANTSMQPAAYSSANAEMQMSSAWQSAYNIAGGHEPSDWAMTGSGTCPSIQSNASCILQPISYASSESFNA
eukprot:917864-Pleurochrysis_carterae.AAC.3